MEEVKKDEKDLKKKVGESNEGEVEETVIDTEGNTPEGGSAEPSDTKKESEEPEDGKEGAASIDEKEPIEGNASGESKEALEVSKEGEPQEKKEDEKAPEGKTDDKALVKDLEDKEKELAKREEELSKREIEAGAKSLLRDKGMSEEVLPLVLRGSLEDTKASIELLEKVLGDQVEKKLSEVAKGKSPEGSKGNISKETGSMVDAFRAKLRG